jgi:hypothetical protein
MHLKLGVPVFAESVYPSVVPDIATVAAEPAELHIVDVRRVAVLENEHEFVLRAVETPHPGIGLCPDTEVFEPLIGFRGRRHNRANCPRPKGFGRFGSEWFRGPA